MPTPCSFVRLIWPVMLPWDGSLRVEIDADADDVSLERADDGALTVSAGGRSLLIPAGQIEELRCADGEFKRTHAGLDAVQPEVRGELMVLYRPVGDAELALVAENGFRRFPPRLPDQPIFYPVTNLAYAREIAEGWNLPENQGVHVLRFLVRQSIVRFWLPVRCVGARHHTELWIPADDLESFNDAIADTIERVELT